MNSRYIPFTQQKYCCVPTCIQMVMYKNSIPLVNQEVIGNALGLTVPDVDRQLFQNARSGARPSAGWGTQIDKEEFTPNAAFQYLGIPLCMELHLIDKFESAAEIAVFLRQHRADDSDVLVCYDYGTLFDTGVANGHVNVFDSIDIDAGLVTLLDPAQNVPKYRTVSIDKLFAALYAHGSDNSGGFWQLA